MPKMKSHKGLNKRVKVSARGKVRHRRRNGSHLMSAMSPKRCRKLRRPAELHGEIARKARKALSMR